MRSSWKDFNRNTGPLFWGTVGIIVATVFFIAAILNNDNSLLFIFIPFILGSLWFGISELIEYAKNKKRIKILNNASSQLKKLISESEKCIDEYISQKYINPNEGLTEKYRLNSLLIGTIKERIIENNGFLLYKAADNSLINTLDYLYELSIEMIKSGKYHFSNGKLNMSGKIIFDFTNYCIDALFDNNEQNVKLNELKKYC